MNIKAHLLRCRFEPLEPRLLLSAAPQPVPPPAALSANSGISARPQYVPGFHSNHHAVDASSVVILETRKLPPGPANSGPVLFPSFVETPGSQTVDRLQGGPDAAHITRFDSHRPDDTPTDENQRIDEPPPGDEEIAFASKPDFVFRTSVTTVSPVASAAAVRPQIVASPAMTQLATVKDPLGPVTSGSASAGQSVQPVVSGPALPILTENLAIAWQKPFADGVNLLADLTGDVEIAGLKAALAGYSLRSATHDLVPRLMEDLLIANAAGWANVANNIAVDLFNEQSMVWKDAAMLTLAAALVGHHLARPGTFAPKPKNRNTPLCVGEE